MFSISDNGDGTATIFDDGLPIGTIQRSGPRSASANPSGTGHLEYVAQGVEYRSSSGDLLSSDSVFVGIASRTKDVQVDPALYERAFALARSREEDEIVAGVAAELASDGRTVEATEEWIEHLDSLPNGFGDRLAARLRALLEAEQA